MAPSDVVEGTVVRWSNVDGWGVLQSDALDGLVFAHYSDIRDQDGYRSLQAGKPVWFRWERPGQDGCDARALDIWATGRPSDTTPAPVPGPPSGGAYRSTLSITWDDPSAPPDGSPPPRP